MESEQHSAEPAGGQQHISPTVLEIEQPRLTGAGTLLDMAWHQYRRSFKHFAPISLMLLVVVTLQQIAVHSPSVVLSSVGVVAGIVLMLFGYLALLFVITRSSDEAISVQDVFRKAFDMIGPYFLIMVLTVLMIIGGGVLFIIPAVILNVLLSFGPFTFALEEKRGLAALVQSWYYVRGRWWSVALRLLVYVAVLLLVYIGVSIVFLIAKIPLVGLESVLDPAVRSIDEAIFMNALESFFMVPFGIAFMYVLYTSLRATKFEPLEEAVDRKIRRWLKIFLGLGIAAVILGSIGVMALVRMGFDSESPVLREGVSEMLLE